MAAPHVTGTVALVISSGYSGDIRARLRSTAEALGGQPYEYGYGLVDAAKAAAVN